MPNWCEGYLRVRGPVDNLLNFFENAFDVVSNESRPITDLIKIEKSVVDFDVYFEDIVWLKDTCRGFVEACESYVVVDENNIGCAVIFYKQAWCVKAADLCEIAKKFEVDLRFFGGEQGLCFTQTIEIINGEITIDEAMDYDGDSWEWESPVPTWGG